MLRDADASTNHQSTRRGYNHTKMTEYKEAKDHTFFAVPTELKGWSRPVRPTVGHSEAEKDRPQSTGK